MWSLPEGQEVTKSGNAFNLLGLKVNIALSGRLIKFISKKSRFSGNGSY